MQQLQNISLQRRQGLDQPGLHLVAHALHQQVQVAERRQQPLRRGACRSHFRVARHQARDLLLPLRQAAPRHQLQQGEHLQRQQQDHQQPDDPFRDPHIQVR